MNISQSGLLGNHFMIDLETLSVNVNAVICSVAIIEFDILTGECKRCFYETIEIQSCLNKNLEIESKCLTWWLSQPKESRLEINKIGSKDLKEVLNNVSEFIQNKNSRSTKSISNSNNLPNFVWGNGASFDLAILKNAYKVCELDVPWNFWHERDVRTILCIYPDIKKTVKNNGIKHHPLDDCKYQIDYICKIIQKIFKN